MENLALGIPEANFIINVLLVLVAFFGGMVIKGLSDSVKSLQKEDRRLADKFDDYVKKEDFRDAIAEVKELLQRIFDKLDRKADR